ncbi:hypothetical protein KCG44_11660 [Pacificimonas sp. WHA3]|uniref:Prokaryotic glutathione synthetase ATP-binding domain-containing protein n=1 Tax=Pacificimonas pallii TaxID=2827236 RepID=A0ABS6SGA4_9SPHN|nr:hypothetical protein [Pacificimonas pallii]MBV7257442.1 hypothetical protein [Pacificimonas pallii]
MRIALLTCASNLPGARDRRTDAFEHDVMVATLGAAFADNGDHVEVVRWDALSEDWSRFDGALLGTVWDYPRRKDEFLSAIDRIACATRLFNPPPLVRWNLDKSYLRDLHGKGVPIIPAIWLDTPDTRAVEASFDALETNDIVLKQRVSGNSEGQYRLRRTDRIPDSCQPMFAQPFLPAILEEGEYSFIFIGGHFSHALLKCPASGDYRVQSDYGGTERAITPDDDDLAAAAAALSALEDAPLYARVDMVRGNEGSLLLMELELIEPFLYPEQGPHLGRMLHGALAERLGF